MFPWKNYAFLGSRLWTYVTGINVIVSVRRWILGYDHDRGYDTYHVTMEIIPKTILIFYTQISMETIAISLLLQ